MQSVNRTTVGYMGTMDIFFHYFSKVIKLPGSGDHYEVPKVVHFHFMNKFPVAWLQHDYGCVTAAIVCSQSADILCSRQLDANDMQNVQVSSLFDHLPLLA